MKKLMVAVSALACASVLFAEGKTQWTNLLDQDPESFDKSVWTLDTESGDDMWVENGQIIVDTDIATGAVFTPESVPENPLQSAIHSKVTFDAFIKELPEPGVNQAGLTIVSNDTVDCEFRFLTGDGWVAGNEECPAAELNKEYDLAIAVNYDSKIVTYYLGDGDNYKEICRGTKGGEGTKFNELAVMGTGKFSLIKAGVESQVPQASITLPELPIEGVESLVVSQLVDGVEWTLVEDNKIDDGNQYVVVAIPSEGYRASNPITSDTAEAGEEIVITEEQVKANVAKIAYVAQIGSTKYESLKEAVEAAQGGDTIEVIANCEVPETICFYNTGTNAEDQITLKNDYHVELTTFGPGGKNPNNYSIYIVNANVKVTGTGDFSKTNGSASAFVVGSMKEAGKSGRPATLGCGVLDFEGKLTGGVEGLSEVGYSAAPSGMIKVEAGFCNFIGGEVTNWRNDGSNGKCVSATSMEYKDESGNVTNKFVGVVTIQAGTFKANEPLLAEDDGELHIIGKDNTAKVRPLDDEKELDYSAYCEPGYTFLKVTDDQDPDYQWYKVGMKTFSIVVLGEGCYGTANPNEFTVETEFPLTVALTKPETPEGKKFDSWSANHGEIDGETLTIDAFPNENVIVTVVWKDIHYVAQIVVDEATTNKYASLKEAFEAAQNDQTISVIADCTIDERINVSAANRSITLDATDKIVTCNVIYPIVWSDYSEVNAGTLTVVGGTFQQDTEPEGETSAMILWAKNGKIKVTDGTFNVTKGEGQIAYVGGADATNARIEVAGGMFTICDKASGVKGDVFNVQNTLSVSQIQVTGGSFSKDPAEGDDALGGTFVAKGYTSVANASTGLWDVVPAGPKSEDADIGEPDPSTGIYPVTPKPGSTEVVIENGEGQRFSFPSTVKTIKGVNAEQIFITGNGGKDITLLLTKTGDATTGVTYDLNPEAKDGDIPVKPTIEPIDADFDIAGGTMEVKGIQGLYYSLVGSENVKTVSEGAVCDTATVEKTGDTVSLTDAGLKGAAKFYVIKVSIDAPAAK